MGSRSNGCRAKIKRTGLSADYVGDNDDGFSGLAIDLVDFYAVRAEAQRVADEAAAGWR
jgi:hypothetical protein